MGDRITHSDVAFPRMYGANSPIFRASSTLDQVVAPTRAVDAGIAARSNSMPSGQIRSQRPSRNRQVAPARSTTPEADAPATAEPLLADIGGDSQDRTATYTRGQTAEVLAEGRTDGCVRPESQDAVRSAASRVDARGEAFVHFDFRVPAIEMRRSRPPSPDRDRTGTRRSDVQEACVALEPVSEW